MKAVILNSGLGVRMQSLTVNSHKSMVRLANDETVFHRQIRILAEAGITDFLITTGPFEQQLHHETEKKEFQNLNFTFVNNPLYQETNYIYSLYLARKHLKNNDTLLLHGDLVFNRQLITDLLANQNENLGLINSSIPLPAKDFKAQVSNGVINKISVTIFEKDCFAFQPLYKLEAKTFNEWMNKIIEFVENDQVKVYAEEAFNVISSKLKLNAFDYSNYYINEIDTAEDLALVSQAIRDFDCQDQIIINYDKQFLNLKTILVKNNVKKPLIVASNLFQDSQLKTFFDKHYPNYVLFQDYSPNPQYEEAVRGIKAFKDYGCDFIVAIGGGSAIDIAKCIKLFTPLNEKENYLDQDFTYSPIKQLTIPTTAGTGSEATRFAVIYYQGEKQSIAHDSIIPEYVLLYPDLLQSLPDYHKKSALLDALSQAIESLWSINSNSNSQVFAKKSIELILQNVDGYLLNQPQALKNMLLAANYSGKAINITETTAAHAMSYKITSLYNIAHGHAVAVCLPHIWDYMSKKVELCRDPRGSAHLEQVFSDLNKLFKAKSTAASIEKFNKLYQSLKLDTPILPFESDLDILVKSVNLTRLKNNPIELDKTTLRTLYQKALTNQALKELQKKE